MQNERSYHLAPVAAAGPSLLSTWDTLIYLLPQGLSAMAVASDQLAKDIEDSVDQTQNLPSVEQLQAARALLTESVDIARKYLKPTPRRSRPIFWVRLSECWGSRLNRYTGRSFDSERRR